MAKIIDTIIQSEKAPNKTNVLWDNGKAILRYKDDEWVPIGGVYSDDSDKEATFRPYIAYSNSADGKLDFTTDKQEGSFYDYLGVAVAYTAIEPKGPEDYEWSYIKGPRGPQGPTGPIGPQGPQGPVGGTAVSSLTVIAYRTYVPTAEKPIPDRPTGGSWDVITNTIVYPVGWGKSDNLNKPIWMSSKTFYTDKSLETSWSIPTLISAIDGKDGMDGESIEFMYKRTKYYTEVPPTIPIDQANWNPKDDGWTDDPVGITENMQCEWMINRTTVNGVWKDWNSPTLWSKWSVNGKDGAGVEYIFYRNNKANSGQPPADPTPVDWKTNSAYQNTDAEYEVGGNWTDEPLGVNESYPTEWVCVRKYKKYTDPDTGITTENKIWNPYSKPALWSNYSENGKDGWKVRTMYYSTTDTTIRPPFDETNGSNPGSGWSDVFPTNYNEDMVVWAIDSYVDVEGNMQGVWTNLRLITGIKGKIDVPIYYNINYYTTTESTKPNAPKIGVSVSDSLQSTDGSGNTIYWIDYPTDGSKQWYQIVGKVNTNTNTIVEWGAISIWNGKDGDAQDGTYWDEYYAIISIDDVDGPPVNRTSIDPNRGLGETIWKKFNTNTKVEINAFQRMWGIKAKLASDGNSFLSGGWSYPYPISGERGATGEQGIKGDKGDKGDTGPTGPRGPAGSAGINGVSYKELYMLGTEDGPMIDWDDNDKTNLSPGNNNWLTSIPTTNNSYPYIWCIKARILNGDFEGDSGWEGPFRLSGLNGINGTNGTDGVSTDVGILSNPADIVVADASGKIITGLPVSTTFRIISNAEDKVVKDFYYEVLHGAGSFLNITSSDTTITITGINEGAPKDISIKIGGKQEGFDTEHFQIFSLKIIDSSELPLTANLSDDNIVVPVKENTLLVKEFSNTFEMYVGTIEQPLIDLYLSDKSGNTLSYDNITFTPVKNASEELTGDFKLTLNDNTFVGKTDVIVAYITGKCLYKGETKVKTLKLKITRVLAGEDGSWYELKVNTPTVKLIVDPKEYFPWKLETSVIRHKGNNSTALTIEEVSQAGLHLTAAVDDANSYKTLQQLNYEFAGFEDLESSLRIDLRNAEDDIIDTETITVVSDGLGAVVYRLQTNIDTILVDKGGNILNTEEYLSWNVIKIDGDKYTLIDSSNWRDYSLGLNVNVYFDGEQQEIYQPFQIPLNQLPATKSVQIVLYDATKEPDLLIDYKTIIINKEPNDGDRGPQGQIVYPAGIYNDSAEYIATSEKAPYVYFNNEYYVLKAVGFTWIGTEQPDGTNPSTATDYWEKFEGFEAIYADIGILKQALIGSAVFYGNFIFSQTGLDNNGDSSSHYENFGLDTNDVNIIDSEGNIENFLTRTDMAFYPTICFNFKTGEGWMSNRNFCWDSEGNVYTGNIKVDNNTTQLGETWKIDSNGNIISINGNSQFNANGSGFLGNNVLEWNKQGDVEVKGDIKFNTESNYITKITGDAEEETIVTNEGTEIQCNPIIKVLNTDIIPFYKFNYRSHGGVSYDDVPDYITSFYIKVSDYDNFLKDGIREPLSTPIYALDDSGFSPIGTANLVADAAGTSASIFRYFSTDTLPYIYVKEAGTLEVEKVEKDAIFTLYNNGVIKAKHIDCQDGYFSGTINADGNFTGSVISEEGNLSNYKIQNSLLESGVINCANVKLVGSSIDMNTSSALDDEYNSEVIIQANYAFTNKTNNTFTHTHTLELTSRFDIESGDVIKIPVINYTCLVRQPQKNKKWGVPKITIELVVITDSGEEEIYSLHTSNFTLVPSKKVYYISKTNSKSYTGGSTISTGRGYLRATLSQTLADRIWPFNYSSVYFLVDPNNIAISRTNYNKTQLIVRSNSINITSADGTYLKAGNGGIIIQNSNGKGIKINSSGVTITQ